MKLHLTYIQRTPRTSVSNKPYTSVSIKAQEYGDRFLSGFGNKANENWKVGDEVEVEAVKEVPKGDKVYLNFEMAKAGAPNAKQHEEIMSALTFMKIGMQELLEWKRMQTGENKPKILGTDIPYPTPEEEGIDIEGIDFDTL